MQKKQNPSKSNNKLAENIYISSAEFFFDFEATKRKKKIKLEP